MNLTMKSFGKCVSAMAFLLVVPAIHALPAVQNGDFGAGSSSWTMTGVSIDTSLTRTVDASGILSNGVLFGGSSARYLSSDAKSGILSQTFSSSFDAASSYRLTFFFHGALSLLNSFTDVTLTDLEVDTLADFDVNGWGRYTGLFTGYKGDSLAFRFVDAVASSQLNIDDISLACVTVPGQVGGDCGGATNQTPEPGTLLLIGAALAGMAVVHKRKLAR